MKNRPVTKGLATVIRSTIKLKYGSVDEQNEVEKRIQPVKPRFSGRLRSSESATEQIHWVFEIKSGTRRSSVLLFPPGCLFLSLFDYLSVEMEQDLFASIDDRHDLQGRSATDRAWKESKERKQTRISTSLIDSTQSIGRYATRLGELFTPNRSARLSSRWKPP